MVYTVVTTGHAFIFIKPRCAQRFVYTSAERFYPYFYTFKWMIFVEFNRSTCISTYICVCAILSCWRCFLGFKWHFQSSYWILVCSAYNRPTTQLSHIWLHLDYLLIALTVSVAARYFCTFMTPSWAPKRSNKAGARLCKGSGRVRARLPIQIYSRIRSQSASNVKVFHFPKLKVRPESIAFVTPFFISTRQ